jgi:hypothetical protein
MMARDHAGVGTGFDPWPSRRPRATRQPNVANSSLAGREGNGRLERLEEPSRPASSHRTNFIDSGVGMID